MKTSQRLIRKGGKHVLSCRRQRTVWIYQDFSVIQILREIKIGESRNPKIAIFAILEALDFVSLVNFSLQKVQKLVRIKIQSLQMC